MAENITNRTDDMTRRASELASQGGERAAESIEQSSERLAEQTRSTGQKLADIASSTGEKISGAASTTGHKLADATVQAKEFVSTKVSEAGEKIHELREVDYGQMYEGMKTQIRTHPTESLLISAAIGFSLGLMMRSGRR